MKPEKENESELIPPTSGPPDFDLSAFREEIDELEISDDQARALLQVLWNIMCTAVDIGWGVDIVQIVLPQLFSHVANDNNAVENGGMDD